VRPSLWQWYGLPWRRPLELALMQWRLSLNKQSRDTGLAGFGRYAVDPPPRGSLALARCGLAHGFAAYVALCACGSPSPECSRNSTEKR
jgi:hypothetical protein